jgi:hypothetical protein
VAPLWLGGIRGKQSTPSIGWEVPVRSRRSVIGSGMERVDDTRSRRAGKGTPFRLNDTICMMYDLDMLV